MLTKEVIELSLFISLVHFLLYQSYAQTHTPTHTLYTYTQDETGEQLMAAHEEAASAKAAGSAAAADASKRLEEMKAQVLEVPFPGLQFQRVILASIQIHTFWL
jgi:hypothetical protein